jgi:hypothetical protein
MPLLAYEGTMNEHVRFAVLSHSGLSSNSWGVWVEKDETVYIVCRDSFQEVKVSLHPSPTRGRGRWRVGFDRAALSKIGGLLPSGQNRAWDVWDEPEEQLPKATIAFKPLFPTSELIIPPEKRHSRVWNRNAVFIEAAPPGKITAVTLFITDGEQNLVHASEPSITLARLPINRQRVAQLVAHGDPEGDLMQVIDSAVSQAISGAHSKGIEVPNDGYGYFVGRSNDGCRFIFGARMKR